MRYINSLAIIAITSTCALVVGCAGKESASQDTTASVAADSSDRTTVAANVATAIKANPSAADSILKANGYTRDSFEREMYDIAADSAKSAQYAAAKKS